MLNVEGKHCFHKHYGKLRCCPSPWESVHWSWYWSKCVFAATLARLLSQSQAIKACHKAVFHSSFEVSMFLWSWDYRCIKLENLELMWSSCWAPAQASRVLTQLASFTETAYLSDSPNTVKSSTMAVHVSVLILYSNFTLVGRNAAWLLAACAVTLT